MVRSSVSRRVFLGHMGLASAAAALSQAPDFMTGGRWFEAAHAQELDVVRDTYNGLLAFVVPGSDLYSRAQGVSTPERGGVDAGAAESLIETIDRSTPLIPQFSAQVAALLNGVAAAVNPAATGPFASPFARLPFAHKAAVFQFMDASDAYRVLSGVLPAFVAFFVYSEAGTFDTVTRSLTGKPLGWTLSNYQGVADGRDEFRGYLKEK